MKAYITEASISVKGQIVIPADLRRKYGIEPGAKIFIEDEGDRIVLRPITTQYIRSLRGSFKDGKNAMKVLKEERRRERNL